MSLVPPGAPPFLPGGGSPPILPPQPQMARRMPPTRPAPAGPVRPPMLTQAPPLLAKPGAPPILPPGGKPQMPGHHPQMGHDVNLAAVKARKRAAGMEAGPAGPPPAPSVARPMRGDVERPIERAMRERGKGGY